MMATKLNFISKKAKEERSTRFNNLMHLINERTLWECVKKLKKGRASGVDRVTLEEYQRNFFGVRQNFIEDVWADMKREEFKSPFLTSHISPYEKLIHLLFKQDKGTQAFEYSERSKARSFLYLLGNPDGSLVFSEKEVEELKGLYNLNPKIYIGKEATETRARADGPSADMLHFSCHGLFDYVHPLYSALILAPDGKKDGRLEVQEIFQLELKPAYLVTLSACQTNVDRIKTGDEIVMMWRAFIHAGTPSVLARMWGTF